MGPGAEATLHLSILSRRMIRALRSVQDDSGYALEPEGIAASISPRSVWSL